ncbi:HlyD family efflux transporter periplasmic adaptor subunit [Chitinophaga oryziterrae]|uniref:HlyD family efflux transporter periplasmic adaptor subunit n=1 Tax=Chitinophaga oryziterrae TaxID=1031224 RepID=A0A6N8JD28_9BACT|nr:efflux RND transporter periplasmic adaptor subunit [Chitinophaga oryziterrae]MVT42834.1 HlyD family efflux transporter periplasmic adaptor subunit [Chitinophaga oryziterrae]
MKNKVLIIAFGFYVIISGQIACSGGNPNNKPQKHGNRNTTMQDHTGMDMVTITKRDEEYANIHIDTVRVKTMAEYSTLLGTTNFDERKITVITSRLRGRLDKLFVNNPQQQVLAGQPLYAIYSEELLSYENEYLNALQQQAEFVTMKQIVDQLVDGAKKKLLLLGLTGEQIALLETTRVASPLVTYYSPVSGTLVDLSVGEGQYVETGSPLFRLADLSAIWIEAQMYTSELKWLHEKPSVTVEFDTYPGEVFNTTAVFDNPTIEPDQKISLVRFQIISRRHQLKPGMMAYVNIRRNDRKTMVIPKSAILIGNMVTAWVKTGEGVYENRVIEPGIQNKNEVEVLHGIKVGELIVTSGAYLLNSALVLKKGAGMGGMKM